VWSALRILDKCTEASLPGRMGRAERLDRGSCRGNGKYCRAKKDAAVRQDNVYCKRWRGEGGSNSAAKKGRRDLPPAILGITFPGSKQ
jgi:hypothetical protein